MQEDFPNTASNYKIFKDSDGKEYYSCIDWTQGTGLPIRGAVISTTFQTRLCNWQ